jgi:hypothetical protein
MRITIEGRSLATSCSGASYRSLATSCSSASYFADPLCNVSASAAGPRATNLRSDQRLQPGRRGGDEIRVVICPANRFHFGPLSARHRCIQTHRCIDGAFVWAHNGTYAWNVRIDTSMACKRPIESGFPMGNAKGAPPPPPGPRGGRGPYSLSSSASMRLAWSPVRSRGSP